MGNAIRNCGSKELSGAAARTGILIKKARTIYKRKDALMFIENVGVMEENRETRNLSMHMSRLER